MNYGQICTGGIGCTITNGDRTMADFFAVYLDRGDGAMRIVYNDVTSQHHGAHVFETRQVAGPSATGGTVSRSVPASPVTDPTGDAQTPHYAPIGPGANLPAYDFTNLRLSQPNPGTLRVEMTLAGNPALATPPQGKANGLWLTRFQALSVGDEGEESYRIFYVGAEKPAIGSATFFAGSGKSAEDSVLGNGCLVTTPEKARSCSTHQRCQQPERSWATRSASTSRSRTASGPTVPSSAGRSSMRPRSRPGGTELRTRSTRTWTRRSRSTTRWPEGRLHRRHLLRPAR
jgi:hypothetical protein